MNDYAGACRKATTDQGLDPVVSVLTALEIPVTVDQTGGFTMVARVQLRDHDDATWLGITEEVHTPKPRYLVCRYDGIEDYEGTLLDTDASLATVVYLIGCFMRDEIGDVHASSIMVTCDVCGEGECTEAEMICDECAERIAIDAHLNTMQLGGAALMFRCVQCNLTADDPDTIHMIRSVGSCPSCDTLASRRSFTAKAVQS